MDSNDLDNRFAYHPPKNENTAQTHGLIRDNCRGLAAMLDAHCPDSRELSLAITKLEEVMYWANAAIARAPENVQ